MNPDGLFIFFKRDAFPVGQNMQRKLHLLVGSIHIENGTAIGRSSNNGLILDEHLI
jgi:hypothetical protein